MKALRVLSIQQFIEKFNCNNYDTIIINNSIVIKAPKLYYQLATVYGFDPQNTTIFSMGIKDIQTIHTTCVDDIIYEWVAD